MVKYWIDCDILLVIFPAGGWDEPGGCGRTSKASRRVSQYHWSSAAGTSGMMQCHYNVGSFLPNPQNRPPHSSSMRARSFVSSGPWFNIKMSSYQYGKSHCGDKTVVRSSYLHNGISYTGKMTSLYWFSPLCLMYVLLLLLQCHIWYHDTCIFYQFCHWV